MVNQISRIKIIRYTKILVKLTIFFKFQRQDIQFLKSNGQGFSQRSQAQSKVMVFDIVYSRGRVFKHNLLSEKEKVIQVEHKRLLSHKVLHS